MKKLAVDSDQPDKSAKTTKKPARKEKTDEDGFSKVGKKTRKPRSNDRQKFEPSDCSLCDNEKHWLHDCKKFTDLDVEDRWEYCTERSVCPRCLRRSHKLEACTFVAKCRSCGGGHNSFLHGAKNMPEELKRPMEVEDKQA